MWTELERLAKQIAYGAEEIELKHQLAWAKVHISEQESAALLERIAKKNEVMRLLIPSGLCEGGDTFNSTVIAPKVIPNVPSYQNFNVFKLQPTTEKENPKH